MTQSAIRDRISLELAEWGAGYTYKWSIERGDTTYTGEGTEELRQKAEEKDTVRVTVYTTRQPEYGRGTEAFVIEPLDKEERELLQAIKKERRERWDLEQNDTYEFRDRCMDHMHDGRSREETCKILFGDESHTGLLNKENVQSLVSQVWFWASMQEVPQTAIDASIGNYRGKNYEDHKRYGQNAIVIRSEHIPPSVILHECSHGLLRGAGLPSHHNPQFRKLELDLYRTFLPGFEYDKIEARAVARKMDITIDWNFDIDKTSER